MIDDSMEISENFTDISEEISRSYNFGTKGFVRIEAPMILSVSSSGGHKIASRDGKYHYIPKGWIQLSWMTHASDAGQG